MNRNNTGIVLTDRNDVPFFTFYSAHTRSVVSLEDIPEHTRQAIIAAEDQNFYNHPGFSVRGIIRAAFRNLSEQNVVAGGSTITQQLVKNSLLTPKRDFLRKFQEVILAQEIERKYSKNEILEMYLNSVYFGNGAFGIEEAAQRYFGKPASKLTLAESSLLVGILPAPSAFSPQSGRDTTAKSRQEYVLNNMVEQQYITNDQKEKILQEKLVYTGKTDDLNNTAPHFALMVRNELIQKYGEEKIIRSGYKVRTTLDLEKQTFAERVVSEEVQRLAGNNVTNGAVVVTDPKTGEILALVGSSNWYNEQFGKVNVATQLRQPGSSFKPLVYALALENHTITPATVLHDRPTTFGRNYKPQNYDRQFRGNVFVRRALANSLNVPAVEVMTMFETEEVLDWVKKLGITTLKDPENYGPSLVLGAGEVRLTEITNAYAVFANNGRKNDITTIQSITDKFGKSIYSYTPKNEEVVSNQVAFLISSILSDNSARAEVFGNSLTISRTAAVKTGTTENYRDALTIGYTPQLVVGVWVGNNDGEPMDHIAGSLGAAPIWKRLMETFHEDKPVVAFTPPQGVIAQTVCGQEEYFIRGTRTTRRCPLPRRVAQENENPFDSHNRFDSHDPFESHNPHEVISEELRRHREVVRQLLEERGEEI